MQMSLFCFRYLTSPAFDLLSQDGQTAHSTSLTGFYGFFNYAAAHWDHHSLHYVRQAFVTNPTLLTEEGLRRPLSTAWMKFVKRFNEGHNSLSETSSEHGQSSDTSVPKSVPLGSFDFESESCNIHQIFGDWSTIQRSTEFEKMATSLRQAMQQIDLGTLQDRERSVYLSLNGPFRPRCSRRACLHFNTGFDSEAELSEHALWHEMAFKCPHTGCYAWLAGFPTSALLQIHLKKVHPTIDPEENLFPIESRSRPRTLMDACRLGRIEWVRKISIPMFTEADILAANKALYTAAEYGHLAICVHLTQKGANPYAMQSATDIAGRSFASFCISVIQMSIRLGDLDLFSALRSAAPKHHEMAFIKERHAISECILDALESPNPQFLVAVLAWNRCRAEPLTLSTILLCAGLPTQRQEYGLRKLSLTKRPVLLEHPVAQERLQTLMNSELETHRKCGRPPELCYKQVLVALDAIRESLLHRLCGSDREYTAGAVKFLLNRLKSEDIQRHDLMGQPPLFRVLRHCPGVKDAHFNDRASIIRAFFEIDLNGANTRDAAGQGPLEFAFSHTSFHSMPLLFELCGADYSVLRSDDLLALQTDRESEKMRIVFGLDSVAERLHVAVEFKRGQVNRFIQWLTDMYREYDTSKMLESLYLHLPRETTSAGYILQSDKPKAAMLILSLETAERLPESCRPKLEDLGRTQLRKLIPGTLRPK